MHIKNLWREFRAELCIRYLWPRYFCKDGEPKRCAWCGCTEFKQTVVDRLDGTPCEVAHDCTNCPNRPGYWSYGYWDPCYYVRIPLREWWRRMKKWM